MDTVIISLDVLSSFFNIWDISFQTSRKPQPTPKKWKFKEPQVPVVKSGDGSLSPDTSKQAKKKKKKLKTSDATSQTKAIVAKVQPKKHVIPKVLEVDPEAAAKTTLEWLKSNNSIPKAEGPKVRESHLFFFELFYSFSIRLFIVA